MINVTNGNLLVQSSDMDISERGIDLAFERTYNSQSRHDASNTDGSGQGIFGNGWTATFDSHLAYDSAHNVMKVYDLDGARYDYTSDGQGHWIAPPGMAGTQLTVATIAQYANNTCYYQWTKKNGTSYIFAHPNWGSVGCGGAGYNGRVMEIFARNSNNSIQFAYSWYNGDASTPNNITQITASHADGQSLTLAFATFGGHNELHTVTRSADGQSSSFWYDSSGNLTDVCEIGNGSSTTASGPCNAGQIHYQYAYASGSYQMSWVNSANWVMTNYNCGTYQSYGYDGSGRVTSISNTGTSNPYIADASAGGSVQTGCAGSGSPLQPSYAGTYGSNQTQYYWEDFAYGSGQTTITDSDGHKHVWTYDTVGRITEGQQWPDPNASFALTTYASWDTDGLHNNNLNETVDARGNPTDYGYDANGNTIWVQEPSVTTSIGTGRPVARYTYDQYNNVVAYCDPQYIWNSGATTCPATSGVTHYTWNYSDSNEIYGYLTDSYQPLGYHVHYAYDPNSQAGVDAGLPTAAQGDAIVQSIDGSTPTRTPTQTFSYNQYGDLVAYNKGNGAWALSYDSLNRLLTAMDPDNVHSYTCYNSNGQVQYKETASQHAADGSPSACQVSAPANAVAYAYDADGNTVQEVHHYGGSAGTILKWYDGADRLVEVQQPQDPNSHDYYPYPWLTRYIYDISRGQNVSVDGASFRAYGNLYKTMEYVPGNPSIQIGSTLAAAQWMDVRGTSFDGLDRAVASYENAFGTTPKITNTYDTNGNAGLLSEAQNAAGQQNILTYDRMGRIYQKEYQSDGGVTPWLTYTYDPDGRTASINSSKYGTETYSYNSDSQLVTIAEPQGGGYSSSSTLNYAYYGDGKRMSVSVSSSYFSQTNLFQYAYRPDGEIEREQVNGANSGAFSWTYTSAGRELAQTDPYTGNIVTLTDANLTPVGTRTLKAKTYTYDSYGRVSSLILPEGYTYNTFAYDTEDETTAFNRSNAWCVTNSTYTSTDCVPNVTNSYTVRGELSQHSNAGTPDVGSGQLANGTIVQNGSAYSNLTSSSKLTQFDARSGMATGMQDTGLYQGTYTTYNVVGNLTYGYDAAGRQTVLNGSFSKAGGTPWAGTATRAYDAENHIVSQTYQGNFACPGPLVMCGAAPNMSMGFPSIASGTQVTYGWGPDGHLAMRGATSVHWDGDDELFSSSSTCCSVGIVIGKLGVTTNASGAGMTIADRDMNGQVVATHMTDGFSAWSDGDPVEQSQNPKSADNTEPATYDGAINSDYTNYGPMEPLLSYTRTDGYADGYGNTFQGVRAFDQNTAQWTAPDAYAGEIHDPMSQKPFMWNRNNPLEYSDPSGYDSVFDRLATGFTALLNGLIRQTITKPLMKGGRLVAHGSVTQKIAGAALIISTGYGGGLEGNGANQLAKETANASLLLKADLVGGTAFAGAGAASGKAIDDLPRLLDQYGGNASDWAKMTTETYTAPDGAQFAIHWYENVSTRLKVEFKSSLIKHAKS